MFERLKSLTARGKLSNPMIADAEARGWITPEQAAELAAMM